MSKAHHPEIGSLLRIRDEIRDLLAKGVYIDALNRMTILLTELKPDDKTSNIGKTLLSDIEVELNYIREIYHKDPGVVSTHTFNSRKKYRDLYGRINDVLWKGDYLLDSSYEFWDPSNGRRSEE